MTRFACPICAKVLLGTADGFRCEHCQRDWSDEDIMPVYDEPKEKKKTGLNWHKPMTDKKPTQGKLFED